MRIILADDQPIVRESLRQFVEQLAENAQVMEAGSLDEVRAHAGHQPDLIMLDLQMPGMKGPQSVADVRQLFPDVPIAVISGLTDPVVIRAVIQAGANGYIPKTARGKSLLSALRMIIAGETYLPPSLLDSPAEDAAAQYAPTNVSPPSVRGGLEKLSEREAATLRLLLTGKSNKEIARELDLQEVTVKVHLRNVYRKINANSRTDAVRIAMTHSWH